MGEKLQRYRRRVDRIDGKLARLLVKRYREVRLIGGLKRGAHRDVVDHEREDEVLQRVQRLAKGEEQKKYIRSIYQLIFKESSNIQRGRA
jgi:chorismate mutase